MPQAPDLAALRRLTFQIRRDILIMLARAGSGHPGGSLSMVELLVGLFWTRLRHRPHEPEWPDRDRFVLSKGHGCPALYVVLAHRGYFPREELATLRQLGSRLQGHPHRGLPGLETSSGSLGQGLSMANGIALALRMDRRPSRVYCLMGDGETEEGQIWEAAMTAGHYHLDQVCGIVDANGLQQNGPVTRLKTLEPMRERWMAFGWSVIEVDGHDLGRVIEAYEDAERTKGRPTLIVARTVKGKGVSFMEGIHTWHGKAPTAEELERALRELADAEAALERTSRVAT